MTASSPSSPPSSSPANPASPASPHPGTASGEAPITVPGVNRGCLVPQHGQRRKRSRIMGLLMLAMLLAGAAWGAWWWFVLRGEEKTDDAYVAGDLVTVTARTTGTVIEILTDEADLVEEGAMLVRLDPADARLALDAAMDRLAVQVRTTRQRIAEAAQLEAVVGMRRVELAQRLANLARREALGRRNAVGVEELQLARESVLSAEKALVEARERRNATRALLLDTPLAEQPAVRLAAAEVRARWLDLARTEVRSPVSGKVARRAVQLGGQATPGKALMAVVPLDGLWVDANFKEVQLKRMRVGQPVRLRADLYGRDVTYTGKVAGLAAGTGSVFSLLPPQNATGNWIKIVQRVPVRIQLDPAELQANPLLAGLSMLAIVDVRDNSGPMLESVVLPPRRTRLVDDAAAADARIAAIIAANAQVAPEADQAESHRTEADQAESHRTEADQAENSRTGAGL